MKLVITRKWLVEEEMETAVEYFQTLPFPQYIFMVWSLVKHMGNFTFIILALCCME
jgi:hypothetical protein